MLQYLNYLWQKYIVVKPSYDIIDTLKISPSRSPNFNVDKDRKVKCIVLHNTGSDSLSSTLKWFGDRLSGVSAHYVIDKDGSVTQCVALKDVAWHAGKSSWRGLNAVNRISLGIELVSKEMDGTDITKAQADACLTLCWVLLDMYGLDADSITTHKDICPDRKRDQGVSDLEEFKRCLAFYTAYKEVIKDR